MKRVSMQSSLQFQLLWRLGICFVVALMVGFAALAYAISSTGGDLQQKSLELQWRAVQRALVATSNPHAIRIELSSEAREKYDARVNGYLYVVYASDGELLAASTPEAALVEPPNVRRDTNHFDTRPPLLPDGRIVYTLTRGTQVGDSQIWLTVGQERNADDDLLDHIVDEFIEDVLIFGVPLFSIAGLIGLLTVRARLNQVRDLSRQAARVGPKSVGVRLPESDVPAEIVPLVQAVNAAFARLEDAFAKQRQFTADAAHQLRTQLAVIGTRVQLLPDSEERQNLRSDTDQLNRIVRQLLSVARLESGADDAREPVDLCEIAREAVASFADLAIKHGLTIGFDGPEQPVIVYGARNQLLTAIDNLIENAIAYAATGRTVDIEVSVRERQVVLSVLDRGHGIPSEFRELVFRRFWRMPGRRGVPGAGLGLAIVAEIAHKHAGSVEIDGRAGGGAAVSIVLPLAA